MKVNPFIFRSYDIRGVADADLTDEVCYAIGRAYGTLLRRENLKKITLGRDVRLSSPRIHDALLKGLLDAGLHVIDVGMVPTPLLYFSIFHLDTDGGIQITGSHNPAEYNGFKMCKGKETMHGEEIQELRKIIEQEKFIKGKGKVEERDIVEDYITEIKRRIRVKRAQKVVIDPGNGTCGPIAKRLFEEFGCEVECMNCEPDGNFPAHLPDPTIVEFIKDLQKRVVDGGFDFGIGYDGDGDRIGVIDDKGNIIWGDRLLALYSRKVLKENPGAPIIFEVKCSEALVEYIQKLGGKPVMWKTGHSWIKAKMKELNAPLAGEMSGHMFFADNYYGFDDAIFASMRLLEIVSQEGKPLSELVSEIPYYHSTPEIRIDSSDEKKFEIVERLKKLYKEKGFDTIDIDGVRIKFPSGWGLVRASNTQPVLVLRFEGKTEEDLKKIREEVEGNLKKIMQEI